MYDMDASKSISLNATAAVVWGTHGSTGSDAGRESPPSTGYPVVEEPKSSFVVSKFDDKQSRFTEHSNRVRSYKHIKHNIIILNLQ